MQIDFSEKLKKLPPYLFIEIDKKKKQAKDQGVDVIDLGVGDPDLPTPGHIVEAANKAMRILDNQRYPFGIGLLEFRQAVADWYKKRFNVVLDPATEVVALAGSKEGIYHIHDAFVDPGDDVLVPEPGYPVYANGTVFAGGQNYFMPLKKKNHFLPDFHAIPETVAKKASLMFINYPNNPTAACCDKKLFETAVKFAQHHNIIVCHDAAYSEMYYDGEKPASFLEVAGAKEVGIEFHSLSKTYCMTGWRLGWACGNARVLQGLSKVKENVDSGVFQAVQYAGIAALTGDQECVDKMREVFQERRDIFVDGLQKLGWKVDKPKASFYIWAEVPPRYTSMHCSSMLLEKAGIVATPGIGFGPSGEGYIRFALTQDKKRLQEALKRIEKIKW
ncbi:MAG: LL-diaminopimelate aminotransferase [bacterium]|nr:LL-diaminopimelate aminotransferase [bacterium]MDD5756770.1 LL-diaminopimelate aminotransferase [bacterium]